MTIALRILSVNRKSSGSPPLRGELLSMMSFLPLKISANRGLTSQ